MVLKRVQFSAKDKCKSTSPTIAAFKPQTHKTLKTRQVNTYFTLSKYGILLFKIKPSLCFMRNF
ncbi:protein of unknown function [Chryseobacterium sp. JV274]|nr:protein of unknown function [Chryseobacterium sp. JV274]